MRAAEEDKGQISVSPPAGTGDQRGNISGAQHESTQIHSWMLSVQSDQSLVNPVLKVVMKKVLVVKLTERLTQCHGTSHIEL